ncbi:ras-related protein rab11a [Fagus crenata]
MKESSDEEYMIPTSEKVSSLANWSSIPSQKSARIRSRNLELEKPRKISKLMDTKTEVTKPVKLKDNQQKRKGMKIKLPTPPKLLGKQKKSTMYCIDSPIFLGEKAVTPRGPSAATSKQETVSPDNKIQGNKEVEGAINDKQAGVTRKDIDAQTFRDIATKADEISPAVFSSMASDQNVQGVETVSPDKGPQGYNARQGDPLSCNGIDLSLHQNASAYNESSSSDMPVCEEVAGERSIMMAEQELKGAQKTFETHIPEETADGAGANAAVISTSMPSEQVVQAAVVFTDTALQGDDEEMGTYSPDRVSCKSFGPSLFHMASTFCDISSDATSAFDNTVERVGPYSVSVEYAPTLRAIIEKYSDIARDCRLKSPEMLKDLLEKVCTAVQTLQQLPFNKLKEHCLASINDVIVVAEGANLDVEWLRYHHNEIMETVDLIPHYKNLKYDLATTTGLLKSKKEILDSKKLEILKLQSECRMVESELSCITETRDFLKKKINNVQPKLQRYHHRSAGDGLL